MIFFADAQGTITKIINESVYQGSNNANDIIFVAPFSSVIVCVAFVLPNGVRTTVNLTKPNMSEIPLDSDIQTSSGIKYNAWRYLIDYPLTENIGTVKVQFYVYSGSNQIIASYTTTFNVQKGVKPTLPEPGSPESAKSYNQIYNYMAEIEQNIANIINGFRQEIKIIASENGASGTLSEVDAARLANYPFVSLIINDTYTALPKAKIGDKYIFQCVEIGKDDIGAYAGMLEVEIMYDNANNVYKWQFIEEYEDIIMKEKVTIPELKTLMITDNAAKMVIIQPDLTTMGNNGFTNEQLNLIRLVCEDFFIINRKGEIDRTKQIILNGSSIYNINVNISKNMGNIISNITLPDGTTIRDFTTILGDSYFDFYIYK